MEVPRRSIYVMSGRAREHTIGNWKHGVKHLTLAEFEAAMQCSPPPSWNPLGERRCLVFRPSKTWSIWVLENGLADALGSLESEALLREKLRGRLRAQVDLPWWKGPEGEMNWVMYKLQHPEAEADKRKRPSLKQKVLRQVVDQQIQLCRQVGGQLPFTAYASRF